MSFQELVTAARTHFPDIQVKYKNKSWLMKLLGRILFFNPSFMTESITTIGYTIYFPNSHFLTLHPITASIAFMHEVVCFKHTKHQSHVATLYCIYKLGNRLHFNPKLEERSKQFGLSKKSTEILSKIEGGHRPFDSSVFDILDDLVSKV